SLHVVAVATILSANMSHHLLFEPMKNQTRFSVDFNHQHQQQSLHAMPPLSISEKTAFSLLNQTLPLPGKTISSLLQTCGSPVTRQQTKRHLLRKTAYLLLATTPLLLTPMPLLHLLLLTTLLLLLLSKTPNLMILSNLQMVLRSVWVV